MGEPGGAVPIAVWLQNTSFGDVSKLAEHFIDEEFSHLCTFAPATAAARTAPASLPHGPRRPPRTPPRTQGMRGDARGVHGLHPHLTCTHGPRRATARALLHGRPYLE